MTAESDRAFDIVGEYWLRLGELDKEREFRFRDTPRARADAYLRDLTTTAGSSENDIVQRESEIGARFPEIFRAYLKLFGRAPGRLFRGSDVGLAHHDELRRYAMALLSAGGATSALPPEAEVFWLHQGYQFMFISADGMFDGPVHLYTEGADQPRLLHDSFVELLEAEVNLCEQNHRAEIDRGGSWIVVDEHGYVHEHRPARNRGIRPLDHPDAYTD